MAGYRDIAADLRHRIDAGEYPPGSQLPPVAELTATYGVARQTARQAVASLAAAGLVEVTAGRGGTVVLARPTLQRLARTRLSRAERRRGRGAFLSDAEAAEFTPQVDVSVRTEPADDRAAELLGIEPGEQVTVRERVMYADSVPVQLATSRLPRRLTERTAIEAENTGPGGTYARLEEAGHKLTRFTEAVRARPAEPAEATALRLRDGQYVLAVTRIAYAGVAPVEMNDMILTADRYELLYDVPAH